MTRYVVAYLLGIGAFCAAWWLILWARDRNYWQWRKGR